ncbi:MAG: DUF885 domain-containing protein [Pseudomonadales bacterium]
MLKRSFTFLLLIVAVAACTSTERLSTPTDESATEAESAKANTMFDRFFEESVARSPMTQAYLGRKTNMDQWDNLTDEYSKETLEVHKRQLAELQTLQQDKLDDASKLSYALMQKSLQDEIEDYRWRLYDYPVNQMHGVHAAVPTLLINQHQISDLSDAEAYLARLNNVPEFFNQLIASIDQRTAGGIVPPKFVFPHVIRDSRNIIKGAPFDSGKDNTLFADFKGKLAALKEQDDALRDEQIAQLLGTAEDALRNSVKPAYEKLIAHMTELEKTATTEDGVWKWPEGGEFFKVALQRTTTTDLTAEEIHETGLSEVKRIHAEMRKIKEQVDFDGDLQAFMQFMREDKQFIYTADDEGRARYLREATDLIDTMKSRLDELFITKPKADLRVKAVEPFREKSAGKAFYQQPSEDGSRPGLYYANLYDMASMPSYQMEALAYHEGIPGHHMQIAMAQELEGVPKFRKYGRYTAYVEGWGLYSEMVPKEIGLYQDPYSDFGRLAMELWRACRLVVDTGIHAKKWTREQGIDYYFNNTPNAKWDAIKMVERHIVMPSQATAYKIGMLKIVELREAARTKLGDQFDIREFHDVVLKYGPLPLNVLQQKVEEWTANAGTAS